MGSCAELIKDKPERQSDNSGIIEVRAGIDMRRNVNKPIKYQSGDPGIVGGIREDKGPGEMR